MAREWRELTDLTRGRPVIVQRLKLPDSGIAIEGDFVLPPLAVLSAEDQVFVAAFVRCHGSIKKMEQLFGVSYPTIKARLARLAEQLEFVEIRSGPSRRDVLDRLERGEITGEQALEALRP